MLLDDARDGTLFLGVGNGVDVLTADGRWVGTIVVPEGVRNLCFGGEAMRTLFLTARESPRRALVSDVSSDSTRCRPPSWMYGFHRPESSRA